MFFYKLVADISASCIAPDESIVVGCSIGGPSDNSLSLIGDSHSLELLHAETRGYLFCLVDSLVDGKLNIIDDL